MFQYGFYVTGCYGVLVVASLPIMRKIRLPGDFSYGVYIYGFPIQQMLVALQPGWGLHLNQGLTMCFALMIAAASWFLIEKPAIKMGRRFGKWAE